MKLFLSSVLFVLSFSLAAQIAPPVFTDFSVDFSSTYGVIDGSKTYFEHDGYNYVLKMNDSGIHFQKFDLSDSPALIAENTVTDIYGLFTFEQLVGFGGRRYFFYSVWDKENQTEQLFVRPIDLDNLVLVGEPKLLIAIDGKLEGRMMWGKRPGVVDKFSYIFSSASDKLLIYYTYKSESAARKNTYLRIGLNLFDKDLNLVAENDVQMERNIKEQTIIGYEIDHEDNVYILNRVWSDGAYNYFHKKSGDLLYYLEIMKVDMSSGAVTSFGIDPHDKALLDLGFSIEKDQKIHLAGRYRVNKGTAHADGVFYSTRDLDGNVIFEKFHEIPLEIINMHRSKKDAKKYEKEYAKGRTENVYFPYLDIDYITFYDDGGVYMHGETSYSKTVTRSNGSQFTTYYYENILVCRLDADGEVAWMQTLGKSQMRDPSKQFSTSYRHLKINDYHYYIFLDNYRNVSVPINVVPAYYVENAENKGQLAAYRVDPANGNVEKLNILDMQDAPIKGFGQGRSVKQFRPSRVRKAPGNAFAVEFYAGDKEDVMMKVSISE